MQRSVQPLGATSLGPGLKSCRSTLACLAVCFFFLIFSMVFSTYKHRLFFFSSFHTKSHAQLPVRIWLTSKWILKKPTGFISPRYPHDLTKISSENPSGYGRPYFFFPRSYPYQYFDLVLHLSQNAPCKTGGFLVDVTDRWIPCCFSVAVSTRAFQLGSNTFQFFSHYILHCLLHLFPPGGDGLTTARVTLRAVYLPPKKNGRFFSLKIFPRYCWWTKILAYQFISKTSQFSFGFLSIPNGAKFLKIPSDLTSFLKLQDLNKRGAEPLRIPKQQPAW